MDKKWINLTDKEKLEIINPLLENIKNILLSDSTIEFNTGHYNEGAPEIRNGVGELIRNLSYITTETIEIKVNRIKKT